MTTGKTIALTRWTFVTKVISQLFTSLWSINKMMYGALITSGLTGGDSPYTLDSFLFSSFLVKNSNLEDPYSSLGFPGSSDGKNSAYNIIKYYIKFNNIYYKMQEILYKLCVIYVYAIYIYICSKSAGDLGSIPGYTREWQPTPVFLPGEFYGQRSLSGYSPWGRKELDMTEWLTLYFSWWEAQIMRSHIEQKAKSTSCLSKMGY